VAEAMIPFITSKFGNPHSSHPFGKQAAEACEQARHHVASLINADPKNIVFTSGATEGLVTVFRGLASKWSNTKCHFITSNIEHKCIFEVCDFITDFDTSYLSVDKEGLLDPNIVEEEMHTHTLLASVMHVNNEIGVVQDLEEIGK
jgi:cysteine desulfurase